MSPDRAINIAEQKLHMKFTGLGYEYDGNYFLEMAPVNYNPKTDGRVLDSCYMVDSITAKITPYSPMVNKPQDIRKIHYF